MDFCLPLLLRGGGPPMAVEGFLQTEPRDGRRAPYAHPPASSLRRLASRSPKGDRPWRSDLAGRCRNVTFIWQVIAHHIVDPTARRLSAPLSGFAPFHAYRVLLRKTSTPHAEAMRSSFPFRVLACYAQDDTEEAYRAGSRGGVVGTLLPFGRLARTVS